MKTKQISFSILFLLVLEGASAFGEGIEDISIEAVTSIDPDRSLSFSVGIILFLLVLLAVTLALSGMVAESGGTQTVKKAQELFLPIKILNGFRDVADEVPVGPWTFSPLAIRKNLRSLVKRGTPHGEEPRVPPSEIGEFSMVHLRDLSPQNATLVVGKRLRKGQRLSLDLASLPGFNLTQPSDKNSQFAAETLPLTVTAEVKTCRPHGSDQETYMAGIKFLGLEADVQKNLDSYVQNLCSGGRPHLRATGPSRPDPASHPSKPGHSNPPPTNPPLVMT